MYNETMILLVNRIALGYVEIAMLTKGYVGMCGMNGTEWVPIAFKLIW